MQVINDVIQFTSGPYGNVPVKIGTDAGLLPEFQHLYYQAPGYEYPWSWGSRIGWINVIRWNDGSIEVWSDYHPEDPRWSVYARKVNSYFREGSVDYYSAQNAYSGYKAPVMINATFISATVLNLIARTLATRWGTRDIEVDSRGYNILPNDQLSIGRVSPSKNGETTLHQGQFIASRQVTFSSTFTDRNSQRHNLQQSQSFSYPNECLYLNSLNREAPTKCTFLPWPKSEMYKPIQVGPNTVYTQIGDWRPNPAIIGNNLFEFTGSLPFSEMTKFFQTMGVADKNLTTFPQTRYFNLNLDDQIFPPGTRGSGTGPTPPAPTPPPGPPAPPPGPPAPPPGPPAPPPGPPAPPPGPPAPPPGPPAPPPVPTVTPGSAPTGPLYDPIPAPGSQAPTIGGGPPPLQPVPGSAPVTTLDIETLAAPLENPNIAVPTITPGQTIGDQPLSKATQSAYPNAIPTVTPGIDSWVEERSVIDKYLAETTIPTTTMVPDENSNLGSIPIYKRDPLFPPDDLVPLPGLPGQFNFLIKQIYYPFGHPLWGTHFEHLKPADTDGDYYDFGTGQWGSHFSPLIDIPWLDGEENNG